MKYGTLLLCVATGLFGSAVFGQTPVYTVRDLVNATSATYDYDAWTNVFDNVNAASTSETARRRVEFADLSIARSELYCSADWPESYFFKGNYTPNTVYAFDRVAFTNEFKTTNAGWGFFYQWESYSTPGIAFEFRDCKMKSVPMGQGFGGGGPSTIDVVLENCDVEGCAQMQGMWGDALVSNCTFRSGTYWRAAEGFEDDNYLYINGMNDGPNHPAGNSLGGKDTKTVVDNVFAFDVKPNQQLVRVQNTCNIVIGTNYFDEAKTRPIRMTFTFYQEDSDQPLQTTVGYEASYTQDADLENCKRILVVGRVGSVPVRMIYLGDNVTNIYYAAPGGNALWDSENAYVNQVVEWPAAVYSDDGLTVPYDTESPIELGSTMITLYTPGSYNKKPILTTRFTSIELTEDYLRVGFTAAELATVENGGFYDLLCTTNLTEALDEDHTIRIPAQLSDGQVVGTGAEGVLTATPAPTYPALFIRGFATPKKQVK